MKRLIPVVLAGLTACGSQEPDTSLDQYLGGLCETLATSRSRITGDVSNCPGCTIDDVEAALDGDYSTFALIHVPMPGMVELHATGGPCFSSLEYATGKSNGAGALIRLPEGCGSTDSRLLVTSTKSTSSGSTTTGVAYSSQQGTVTATNARTRGADGYFGIGTVYDFDAEDLQFTFTGDCALTMRVYEVCSGPTDDVARAFSSGNCTAY